MQYQESKVNFKLNNYVHPITNKLIIQLKEFLKWSLLITMIGYIRCNEECQPSFPFLFFKLKPSRFTSQQILFLTEFSQFMNKEAPNMAGHIS